MRTHFRFCLFGVLSGWLLVTATPRNRADAAEQEVSNNVDADTWITFESDNAARADEIHGADETLLVRSGNAALTNAVRKPLIRFDITGQTINPNLLYLFEVTTGSDGTSSSTHIVNVIADPALQNFDESTLTWNLAPPSATADLEDFNSAGPAVGTFGAPDLSFEPISIIMLGSELTDAVFDDGGSSYLTFGIGGSNNSSLELQSKETTQVPPAPARLLTYDSFDSVASGLITDGTTWSGGNPPSAGNQYAVVNGDAVTADGAADFNGEALAITDGSLTYAASGVNIPLVVVAAGASVTETTTGEFFLGDIGATTLGQMILNGDLTITAEGGADAAMDVDMAGLGTATVNMGAGATLFLTSMAQFAGVLQFNGEGDEVLYEGDSGGDVTLEMNSTGANRLALNLNRFGGLAENIIFNQPGVLDHQADSTLGNNRLMSPGAITANANVSVDVSQTYEGNERRLFNASGWHGSANISVTGTATDPTDLANNISLNEFESGGTTPEDDGDRRLATDDFSGTLSTSGYINVEIRRHTSSSLVEINQNALLDVGHDEATNILSTRLGDVTVNNGGALEVGFEQLDGGEVGHAPYNLHLTSQRGRSGDLTLASGSETILQISGNAANQFDTISAEGTVTLGGTLELLINPTLTSFYIDNTDPENPVPSINYTPTDGDSFEILSIVAERLTTDFDANGTVGGEDLAIWQQTFALDDVDRNYDVSADVDFDDSIAGFDFLAWQRNAGESGSVAGSITGDFDALVVTDPNNTLAGFEVTKTVTSTAVTITINAAPAVQGVPEPSAALLAAIAVVLGTGVCGRGSLRMLGGATRGGAGN